jgi:hypothetical protein
LQQSEFTCFWLQKSKQRLGFFESPSVGFDDYLDLDMISGSDDFLDMNLVTGSDDSFDEYSVQWW